jgi:predicted ester cyclase
MSVEENKEIVQRYWVEAVGQGDYRVLYEHIDPEWVNHTPGMPDVKGPDGARQINSLFHEAMPDAQLTIHALIGEGDLVAVRFTYAGRHEGELLGVAATGKDVSFTGSAFHRIVQGMITDDWVNFDALGILQQIGGLPGAA